MHLSAPIPSSWIWIYSGRYTLFIADHGEDNTEHRMTGKNTMYEAAARVPMILTGPGVIPGTLHTDPASLFDVSPTVMDLAGLAQKNPTNLAGSSILPIAHGKPKQAGRKDYIVSCVIAALL